MNPWDMNWQNQAPAPGSKPWERNWATPGAEQGFLERTGRAMVGDAVGLVQGAGTFLDTLSAPVAQALESIIPLGAVNVSPDGQVSLGPGAGDGRVVRRLTDNLPADVGAADPPVGLQDVKNRFQDVVNQPGLTTLGGLVGSAAQFGGETFLRSAPSMAAAMVAPVPTIAAQSGRMAEERAANDGRKDAPTPGDIGITLPAAALGTITERMSLSRALTPGTGIGRAAVRETAQEGVEEGAEYLSTTAGTKKGSNLGDLGDAVLAGSIAGGVGGAGVQAASTAINRGAGAAEALAPYAADPGVDEALRRGRGVPTTQRALVPVWTVENPEPRRMTPEQIKQAQALMRQAPLGAGDPMVSAPGQAPRPVSDMDRHIGDIRDQIQEDPVALVQDQLGMSEDAFRRLPTEARERAVRAAIRARGQREPSPTVLATTDAALSQPDGGRYSPGSTPQSEAQRAGTRDGAEEAENRNARAKPTDDELARDQPEYGQRSVGEGDRPFRTDGYTDEEIAFFRQYAEQQAEQARREAPAAPRWQQGKSKASNKEAARGEDGRYPVDGDGFLLSDKGGAIRFGGKTAAPMAGKRIVNVLNKSGTDQIFEPANHPSGEGLTIRVTGMSAQPATPPAAKGPKAPRAPKAPPTPNVPAVPAAPAQAPKRPRPVPPAQEAADAALSGAGVTGVTPGQLNRIMADMGLATAWDDLSPDTQQMILDSLKVDTGAGKLDALGQRLDAVRPDLSGPQAQLDALGRRLDAAKPSAAMPTGQTGVLGQQLDTQGQQLAQRVAAAEQQVADLGRRADAAVTTQLGQLEQKLDDLARRLEANKPKPPPTPPAGPASGSGTVVPLSGAPPARTTEALAQDIAQARKALAAAEQRAVRSGELPPDYWTPGRSAVFQAWAAQSPEHQALVDLNKEAGRARINDLYAQIVQVLPEPYVAVRDWADNRVEIQKPDGTAVFGVQFPSDLQSETFRDILAGKDVPGIFERAMAAARAAAAEDMGVRDNGPGVTNIRQRELDREMGAFEAEMSPVRDALAADPGGPAGPRGQVVAFPGRSPAGDQGTDQAPEQPGQGQKSVPAVGQQVTFTNTKGAQITGTVASGLPKTHAGAVKAGYKFKRLKAPDNSAVEVARMGDRLRAEFKITAPDGTTVQVEVPVMAVRKENTAEKLAERAWGEYRTQQVLSTPPAALPARTYPAGPPGPPKPSKIGMPTTNAALEAALEKRARTQNEPTLNKEQKEAAEAARERSLASFDAAAAAVPPVPADYAANLAAWREKMTYRAASQRGGQKGYDGFVDGAEGKSARHANENYTAGYEDGRMWATKNPAPVDPRPAVTAQIETASGQKTTANLVPDPDAIAKAKDRVSKLPLTRFYANPLDPQLIWDWYLKPSIDGIKWAADKLRNSTALQEARARVWDPFTATADTRIRRLIEDMKNPPTAVKIADMLHTPAGGTASTNKGATLDEGVTARANQALNRLGIILPANLSPDRKKRILTGLRRKAEMHPEDRAIVEKLRQWLNEHLDYMRANGVEIGEVRYDYAPREYDPEKIRGREQEFLSRAAKLYERNGHPDPKAAADALLDTMVYGGAKTMFQPEAGVQGTMFQSREFDAMADRSVAQGGLREFMTDDLDYLLARYALRAAKRAEIAKRFGDRFKRWPDMMDTLAKEGGQELASHLKHYVKLAAGIMPSDLDQQDRRFPSMIHTLGTVGLLEHATFTSLSEIFMPAVRAGNMALAGKALLQAPVDLVRHLAGMPKRERMQAALELAEDIGAIVTAAGHSLQLARFHGNAGSETTRLQAKVLERYFRTIGLEQFTTYTRITSTEAGVAFTRRLALAVQGQSRLMSSKIGQDSLRELGIPEQDIPRFAEFVAKLPASPRTNDLRGDMGDLYRAAVFRFVDQTVMRPNASTRPTWASRGPYARMLFALQNYGYTFMKNVLFRQGALVRRGGKAVAAGDMTGALLAAGGLAPLLLVLPLFQYALGEARDELDETIRGGPARKLTDGAKVERALSRAGVFGAVDPYVQFFSGVRYNATVEKQLAGPIFGSLFSALNAAGRAVINNSEETNNAERGFWRAAYTALIEPGLNYAIMQGAMPGYLGFTLLSATRYGQGPAVDALAGKKKLTSRDFVPTQGLSELLLDGPIRDYKPTGRERAMIRDSAR